MKIATKTGLVLAAVGMAIGLLGSPAQADSSWDCITSQPLTLTVPARRTRNPLRRRAGTFHR